MTRRKPSGIDFETWIERQIREARERGEFDDLPGAGEPIPDRGARHDPNWWVKQKLRDEGLSYLPPSLALRRDAAEARERALRARSDAEARDILDAINGRIRDALRAPPQGPSLDLLPFDVEALIAERRRGS
jgi:hypothetical protein